MDKVLIEIRDALGEHNRRAFEQHAELKSNRGWDRAEVFGLWAAAAVGVIAIWMGSSDSNEQRGVMQRQIDEMRQEQKAWVHSVAFTVDKASFYDRDTLSSNGATRFLIPLRVSLKNEGHLPAFGVWVVADAFDVSLTDDGPERREQEACNSSPTASIVLFPSQTEDVSIYAAMPLKETALAEKVGKFWPWIVGCIFYKDKAKGSNWRRTGFIYNTFVNNNASKDYFVHANEASIAASRFRLQLSPLGSFAN